MRRAYLMVLLPIALALRTTPSVGQNCQYSGDDREQLRCELISIAKRPGKKLPENRRFTTNLESIEPVEYCYEQIWHNSMRCFVDSNHNEICALHVKRVYDCGLDGAAH